MEKKNKNFTIIDWDELKYIKQYAEVEDCPKKKPSYTDLLIIFYIKGFGFKGFFGSQAYLGRQLGLTQEQVSRSLRTLFNTYHKDTKMSIFLKIDNGIFFNNYFYLDEFGNKLPNIPI